MKFFQNMCCFSKCAKFNFTSFFKLFLLTNRGWVIIEKLFRKWNCKQFLFWRIWASWKPQFQFEFYKNYLNLVSFDVHSNLLIVKFVVNSQNNKMEDCSESMVAVKSEKEVCYCWCFLTRDHLWYHSFYFLAFWII